MQIRKKDTIYLVSPHLDDAIFSAGGFIANLTKTNKVILVNIFTSSGKSQESLSSLAYLRQIGYKDKRELFKERVSEDKKAANSIGISKVVNLGYVDSLWREKQKTILGKYFPELDRTYPTYRNHIIKGKISTHDNKLVDEIAMRLVKIVNKKDSHVFCPIGFGNHVDHIIAREACRKVFNDDQLTYWTDYPYIDRKIGKNIFYENNIFVSQDIPINPLQKIEYCQKYATQYSQIFSSTSVPKFERYFTYKSKRFKESIGNLLYALVHEPRNTLYNLLNYQSSKVSIKEFSPQDLNIANLLVKKIRDIVIVGKTHLIGSLALKSPGQGDIDIIIGVKSVDLNGTKNKLCKAFGSPTKEKEGFIQWKTSYKGKAVDLDLLDMSGRRFILQVGQIKKIKSDASNLKKYLELKYSTSQTNKFWYSIARVIFFHNLMREKNQDNSYRFHSHFNSNKHKGPYTFAIYQNSRGHRIFVKKWTGNRKNLTYYWLKNEIAVYQILSKLSIGGHVLTPKFIFCQRSKHSLVLGIEHIKGQNLNHLSVKDKLRVFYQSIDFLDKLYKSLDKKDLTSISHRGPLYWLAILPIVSLRAIVQFPQHTPLIVRRVVEIYANSAAIVFRKQRTIVHRDFNDYNCFLYNNKIFLIDFQLTCVADPMVEYAVIILKYFDNEALKMQVISRVTDIKANNHDLVALVSYLNLFAIYDLSLSDGSHFLSLPALQKQLK